MTGEEPDAIFHFRWEEFNTSEATRRADSDFGLILLDRVAPEALGGASKRFFTDVSYVYELTAPMETVVDMTERDRTEQLSAPVNKAAISERRQPRSDVADIRDLSSNPARPAPMTRSSVSPAGSTRSNIKKAARSGRLFVCIDVADQPPLPPITARTVSSGPKSSAPST